MASAFRREYASREAQDDRVASPANASRTAPARAPGQRCARPRRAVRASVLASAAAGVLSALPGLAGGADPPGTATSHAAVELCHRSQSDVTPESERFALLEQSLATADRAVAEDEGDALAHFARFCALGEQARLAGVSVTSLFKLRPIRASVERTLVLAPDFPDALLGKGALLLSLPGLLGGDDAEGERLVRRALEIDPEFLGARLTLAEALADRGAPGEARHEATRALAAAEQRSETAKAARARRLLERLPEEPDRDADGNSGSPPAATPPARAEPAG